MNKLRLSGDWDVAKGKLKQEYGKLTDDDLIGRIQKRVGHAREDVEKAVREIFSA